MAKQRITQVTRQKIVDFLTLNKVRWSGRLSEVDFLSRLYDIDAMSSTDPRPKFGTARLDILQHRYYNEDWDDFWVFTDNRFELLTGDEILLRFLGEMLHPVVRNDKSEVNQLKDKLNEFLRPDGFELFEESQISGHPVYSAREIVAFPNLVPVAPMLAKIVDGSYIKIQIERMESSIDVDPGHAIGTAKDLIETVCKSILDDCSISYGKNDDVNDLMRLVVAELKPHLVPNHATDKAKGEETIRVLLSNSTSVATRTAELRNLYGTGHGKSMSSVGLEPRHARLVVHTTSALAFFLFETHQVSRKTTTV